MRKLPLVLLVSVVCGCGSAPTNTENTDTPATEDSTVPRAPDRAQPTSDKWVTGYYVGYEQDIYPPEAIDFAGITHLTVGRVIPNADGTLNLGFDTHDGPALASRLSTLAHAAGRKAILMVGGQFVHDAWSSAAAPAHRAAFVSNLLEQVDALGYDGLDLDWEPLPAADEAPFTALAQELRAARPNLILTVPLGWGFEASTFVAHIAPLFDQLNVMTYGMADAWDGWNAWHSSAIQGDGSLTPSSVNLAIDDYVEAGIPVSKLGLGIGFYGSCWVGGTRAPNTPTNGSYVAASDGEMSFTNIMTKYFTPTLAKFDDAAGAPYLGSPTPMGPRGCTFVSYEDETSILDKGAYAKSKGLGGAILWTMGQGYLPANPAGSRNPLLAATRAAFLE